MTIDMQFPGDGSDDSPLSTRASHPFNNNTLTLPPLKKNARGAWEGEDANSCILTLLQGGCAFIALVL
eukprot:1144214-Pelagomonas_calceolata.AAC.5